MAQEPDKQDTQESTDSSEASETFTKDEALKLIRDEANKIHAHYKKEIAKLSSKPAPEKPEPEPTGENEKLRKQLADQNRQLQDFIKRDQEREAASRDKDMRSSVSENLQAKGVKYTKQAVAFLADSQRAFSFDDEGLLKIKIDRIEYDDLDQALTAWVKSEDAKPYLAPRDTAGAGSRGSRANQQTSAAPKLTKESFGAAALSADWDK